MTTRHRLGCWIAAFVLTSSVAIAGAQESVPWHDPSTHRVQFVTVGDNVRLAVLVYLDALADPGDATVNDVAFMALYNKLPLPVRESPPPDYTSFAAFRAKQMREGHGVFPESELRQLFAANPDGSMGRYKSPQ